MATDNCLILTPFHYVNTIGGVNYDIKVDQSISEIKATYESTLAAALAALDYVEII